MIKPLIDNEYEDACYELSYNLEPIVMSFIKQNGITSETQIVKVLLNNKELYECLYNYNEQTKKQIESYKVQILLHVIEYINKTNEANALLKKANELRTQFDIV
jgi:hypothetical protein